MADSSAFRCYYEDGSIITSDFCPDINQNGSPLLKSEFQIIQDVNATPGFPWLLVILGLLILFSKEKKG